MKLVAMLPLVLLAACVRKPPESSTLDRSGCFDLGAVPPAGLPAPAAPTHQICPAAGRQDVAPVFGKDGCQFAGDTGRVRAYTNVGYDPTNRQWRKEFGGKAWEWVYFYTAPAGWAYVAGSDLVKMAEGGCDARYGGGQGGNPPVVAPQVEVPRVEAGRLTFTANDKAELRAGDRVKDYQVSRGWLADHQGLDLYIPNVNVTGKPVYAIGHPGSDVYVFCYQDESWGIQAAMLGVGMDHAISYAHLSQCSLLGQGLTAVKAGTQIGAMGNTGIMSSGAHLHMTQWTLNTALDPTSLRQQQGGLLLALARNATVKPVWRKFAELAVSP